jgi:ferritin-like protein
LNRESIGWGAIRDESRGREPELATSAEWHESYEKMSEETLNFSRALKSLQEELEAVDWYNQRVEVTKDEQLRRILAHNRDEEIEHAMMALEYLRRINPVFDRHMRTYLFTEGDILEVEEKAEE